MTHLDPLILFIPIMIAQRLFLGIIALLLFGCGDQAGEPEAVAQHVGDQ